MKKILCIVTGILLVFVFVLPTGALAAENTSASFNFKVKSNLMKHIPIKSINFKKSGVLFAMKNKVKHSISIGSHIDSMDIPTVYEQEPNNDPTTGSYDILPLGNEIIGSMDLNDIDFHKIDVKNTGTMFLTGIASDYHTLGFLLVDRELNVVTTDGDIYIDPDTGLMYEVMPNLQPGIYYAVAIDFTEPVDSYSYDYALYATMMEPQKPVVNTVREGDTVVTGTADPDNTIIVQDGARNTTSDNTDSKGNFRVPIKRQKTGASLSVKAYNPITGMYSDAVTIKVVASVDKTPPSAPKVNQIDDNDKFITGKAEISSNITVKNGKKVIYKTVVDKNGEFKIGIKPLKAGTKLTITATDHAGNISRSTSVTVIDKTAPPTPKINRIDDNDKWMTGKAEAYSNVRVKYNNKVIYSVFADKYGNFKIGMKKPFKSRTKLSFSATDKAGNGSHSVTITVIDKTPPSKLTVNKVYKTSRYIIGKTEAKASITIKVGSKIIGSGKADSKGNFKIKIKPEKSHTTLYISAKDSAGNSKTIKVKVK